MNNIGMLRASKDLFKKLTLDHEAFQQNQCSIYKALDCASSAWHLTDWVFHEYEKSQYNSIGDMRKDFAQSCPALNVMHDLTTGLKHFTVSRPLSEMAGTGFANGYAQKGYAQRGYFQGAYMYVFFSDGTTQPVPSLLSAVVGFWANYFAAK